MAIKDGLTAFLTLVGLLIVVPFVLTAAAAYMVIDLCFGKPARGDDAWEWSEYE